MLSKLMPTHIVIDTNIFVSALLGEGNAARKVLRLCFLNQVQPIMGTSLFLEYEELTARNSVFEKSILNSMQRMELLDDFLSTCKWIDIYYLWRPNLRDEADNHLLELAVAGNAKYLITRNLKDFSNSDLLFPEIHILDPVEFLAIYDKGS